jgi:thiol-disulfide isomerase/thioredoxin
MQTRSVIAFLAAGTFALQSQAQVNVGDKPQLRLRTLENQVLTSEDLAGSLVVLEFWATWCGPCVQQIPHLRDLNAKYAPKGVRLISVSRDDSRGPVVPFIRQHRMTWTHAIDKEQPQQLAPAFGVRGIPHAFIISPDGEVLWRGHPASIDQPLEDALAKHPPKAPGESAREQALAAIARATDLIDKQEDYAGAYEAIAELPDDSFKDRQVAPKFRSLAMRFKPTGRRAEALGQFYDENPEARQRLAKLGVQVDVPHGRSAPSASR